MTEDDLRNVMRRLRANEISENYAFSRAWAFAEDLTSAACKQQEVDIYQPGIWRCAKCNFRLVQSNLNAATGAVSARSEPGDKCPNDGAPLWRVTWREDAEGATKFAEEQFDKRVTAEAQRDELVVERDALKVKVSLERERACVLLEAAYETADQLGPGDSSADEHLVPAILKADGDPEYARQWAEERGFFTDQAISTALSTIHTTGAKT